jgi:hypothetical protein
MPEVKHAGNVDKTIAFGNRFAKDILSLAC